MLHGFEKIDKSYNLKENNEKAWKEFQTAAVEKQAKEAAAYIGVKEHKLVTDFTKAGFSIKGFREAVYRAAALREAQSELALGQLLRAGVQNAFNDMYQAVEVTYTAAVREVSSNKRQEFYAPIERIGFPKRVERQGAFPETSFKGLDIELINVKYGMMFAIERELLDDDQTGQIVQRAGQMGENARIHEEAYVWARLCNDSTATLDGEALPVSATYASPYVTGVPGTSGGIHGSGRGVNATAAGRLSQSQIQAGWILAKKMLDQSGRPMVVAPKILAVSPQDIFFATVLMQSDYNPAVPSATAGATGGTFSINPIKGLAGIVATRFIRDYGALMIDPKGFAFQRRDATEVVQENPQSGPAFSQEVFRYKQRSRWEADFIDPKFTINLNTSFAST